MHVFHDGYVFYLFLLFLMSNASHLSSALRAVPPPCHLFTSVFLIFKIVCIFFFYFSLSFFNDFFVLGLLDLWFLCYFSFPGAHIGGLGAHFDNISYFCDFRDVSGTKGAVPFWGQNRPRTNFLQCCFSMFFWMPTFLDFVWFGMPGGSILAPFRLLFGSPGPLKKQLKVCNFHQIQRFGHFQTESFCRPRSGKRFDDEFFEIFAILCFFEVPIWAPFGTSCGQKTGLKN